MNYIKYFIGIRTDNLLHTTPTLFHLSFFGRYEIPLNIIDEQVNVYSAGTYF